MQVDGLEGELRLRLDLEAARKGERIAAFDGCAETDAVSGELRDARRLGIDVVLGAEQQGIDVGVLRRVVGPVTAPRIRHEGVRARLSVIDMIDVARSVADDEEGARAIARG